MFMFAIASNATIALNGAESGGATRSIMKPGRPKNL
jgi:hypothetical protein